MILKKATRYILGTLLVFLGFTELLKFVNEGYDPNNEIIKVYSLQFQNLFNALMESWYIPVSVRVIHVVSGILLFTKKYWVMGALLSLPIAFNILMMHLLFDIPPANVPFFIIGLFVSLPNILLVISEFKFLKRLIKE